MQLRCTLVSLWLSAHLMQKGASKFWVSATYMCCEVIVSIGPSLLSALVLGFLLLALCSMYPHWEMQLSFQETKPIYHEVDPKAIELLLDQLFLGSCLETLLDTSLIWLTSHFSPWAVILQCSLKQWDCWVYKSI